jgi:hypothetical protein
VIPDFMPSWRSMFSIDSGGILGLYNFWRRPFYRPKENSNHYGMEKAKTVQDVQCFLGFVNFYRLFI